MQFLIAATAAALVGLSSAAPCNNTSGGFVLRAELSDPSLDLEPSAQGTYMAYQRVSQGVNMAVQASPEVSSPVFYVNGSLPAESSELVTDVPGVYPLSLVVSAEDEFDYSYPAEHPISINVNGATQALTVAPGYLTGPGLGTYMVCTREYTFSTGPTTLVVPRFLYEGEELPEDCAPVKFLPECAMLPELPEDSQWNHDYVNKMKCFRP